jgi:putative thioredoxin
VVVDFWAAWCAPCRALAPILEALADEHRGRFVLVKANTEEVPQAAARFGVQGIPAVYAVHKGEIIDFFTGALPEAQVRAWLDRILLAGRLDEARASMESDAVEAERLYRSLLEESPENAEVKIGLAETLFSQDRLSECREIVDQLQQRGFLEPEAEKLKSALELRGRQGDDLEQRRAAAEKEPENLERQLALAEALAGAEQFEEALQICLKLVEFDRAGLGEKARQLMLDVFRVLPEDSPLTSSYRRQLSMLLY